MESWGMGNFAAEQVIHVENEIKYIRSVDSGAQYYANAGYTEYSNYGEAG